MFWIAPKIPYWITNYNDKVYNHPLNLDFISRFRKSELIGQHHTNYFITFDVGDESEWEWGFDKKVDRDECYQRILDRLLEKAALYKLD